MKISLICAGQSDKRMIYDMANEEKDIHDMMFCGENTEYTWDEFNEYEDEYFTGTPCRNNYWLIKLDDEVIGTISHSYNDAKIENMELDIWLRSVKYTGKGYGTDAINQLTDYLIKRYDTKTFMMRPGKHNIGAIKCYEKCGFKITDDFNPADYYTADMSEWLDGDYGVDGTVNMVKKQWVLPAHIVGAGSWVRHPDGRVLLVKNPQRGWELPGGQVEVGETLTQGLKREVYEETGVDIEINQLASVRSNLAVRDGYNGVKTIPTVVSMTFICTYKSGEPRISGEHLDIGWFAESEVVNMVTEPIFLEVVNHLINFDGSIQYYAYNAKREIVERTII